MPPKPRPTRSSPRKKASPAAAQPAKTATGERALIHAIAQRLPRLKSTQVRLGMGDDCAILRPKVGYELVVTTDLLLEGRHFRRDWHSPESVGHRCLARGLSDLAAMGAQPLAAFLSLAVPAERLAPNNGTKRPQTAQPAAPSWVECFFDGLLALAAEHNVPLAGGDTAQSPHEGVLADIILLGQTPRNRALLRSTAQPGDRIYVTGALGGSAAELLAMEHLGGLTAGKLPEYRKAGPSEAGPSQTETLRTEHPQSFPTPRLAVGQALLRRRLATAAIDVSDGLSTDLDHLCEESGLAAVIDASAVPVHPLAEIAAERKWAASALALALHGGEDYELLFTASPTTKMPRQIAGVPIHAIGFMQKRRGQSPRMLLTDSEHQGNHRSKHQGKPRPTPLTAQGWEHFRAPSLSR